MSDPTNMIHVLNTASDVIIQYDERLRYVFINEAGGRYLGLPPSEIVGKTNREILGEQGAAAIEPHLRRVLADGSAVTVDHVLPLPTGTVICESTYTVVPAADGRPTSILGVCRDVTELRRRQAELSALMLSTAKLASLGEMAGSVAHEINTPLTVIQLNAEHLRLAVSKPAADASQAIRAADAISTTVTRIARVIQGLLAYSRDNGMDAPAHESFFKIITDTLVLCQEKFRSHGIELGWASEPDRRSQGAMARCNPVQISQVLLNLLNNAFDVVSADPATSRRWVRLDLRAEDDLIRLSVIDSGKGIAPEVGQNLFKPFFTTKPKGKGTGLGLSIAKRLVESNGGSLSLDATASRTTFVLCLPRARPETGQAAS